jgi:hypothetical protein
MGSNVDLPAKKTISMKSVLITGTNKGIGFERAKQLLHKGNGGRMPLRIPLHRL